MDHCGNIQHLLCPLVVQLLRLSLSEIFARCRSYCFSPNLFNFFYYRHFIQIIDYSHPQSHILTWVVINQYYSGIRVDTRTEPSMAFTKPIVIFSFYIVQHSVFVHMNFLSCQLCCILTVQVVSFQQQCQERLPLFFQFFFFVCYIKCTRSPSLGNKSPVTSLPPISK